MDAAPAPIGHNGGPPLDHVPPWGNHLGTYFPWRAAYRRQRAPASRAVLEIRLRNAERIGLTYDEYAREIVERGRHLSPGDTERIAQIKAQRAEASASEPPPARRAEAPAPVDALAAAEEPLPGETMTPGRKG